MRKRKGEIENMQVEVRSKKARGQKQTSQHRLTDNEGGGGGGSRRVRGRKGASEGREGWGRVNEMLGRRQKH